MSGLATYLLGLMTGLGAAALLWLPARARYRQAVADVRETFRIESGLRDTPDADLADARGAFEQASAAYLAIYPGPGEPDPAWLAFVERWGPDRWETTPQGAAVYRPQHLTVDAEATGPIEPIDIPTVQPVGIRFPNANYPTWGPRPAPISWALTWRGADWLYVPAALVFALIPPRKGRYPWWQKVADRVWEAGVIFEESGRRVNRRALVGLDDLLVGCVGAWEELASAAFEIWLDLTRPLLALRRFTRQVLLAAGRDTPAYRPKRYYPIKEA